MDHWSHESPSILLPPKWSSLVLTHLCDFDGLCRFNFVLSDDEAKLSVVQLPEVLFTPSVSGVNMILFVFVIA